MAVFDVVFEGGGAKGACFAGALDVLVRDHTIGRVIGTSAGAITAALTAAGYTPQEMLDAVTEKRDGRPRFSSFMDVPPAAAFPATVVAASDVAAMLRDAHLPHVPFVPQLDAVILEPLLRVERFRQVFSLVERGGLFSGDTFLGWLHEKLGAKGIGAGCTFAEFHARTHRDLSVVASDTTDSEMLVLNHRTAPGVPVAHAVRMSMSIPFVWQEVTWDAAWGTYSGRAKAGNAIVDGGLLSNFPIRLLGGADDDARALMGDAGPSGARHLGLLIDEGRDVPHEPPKKDAGGGIGASKLVRRFSRLADTMSGAADMAAIREFESRICRLPAKGYGTLEFDLAGERLTHFVDAARQAMTAHLAGRDDL